MLKIDGSMSILVFCPLPDLVTAYQSYLAVFT